MFTSWGISNWVMWKASQETKFPPSLPSRISWQSTQGEGTSTIFYNLCEPNPFQYHISSLCPGKIEDGDPCWDRNAYHFTSLSLARVSSWFLGWYHCFCWDFLSKNIFWAPGKHPELWIAGKKSEQSHLAMGKLTQKWNLRKLYTRMIYELWENRFLSVHTSYLQMLGWSGWFPSEYTPVSSSVASGYNPPRNGGWMGKPSVNLRIFQQAMLKCCLISRGYKHV